MKRTILYGIGIAAIAVLFGMGCNDGGVDVNNGEADTFLSGFADTLAVNVNPAGAGSVNRSPNQAKYPLGTAVTLTAIAEPMYAFVGWSGASTSKDSIITVAVDENITLTANFLPAYTLTVNALHPSGGAVSRNPDRELYLAGDTIIVTAKANPGYTFTGWSGALEDANGTITVIMDGHKILTANFQYDAPFDVQGSNAWEEALGIIKNGGDNKTYTVNFSKGLSIPNGNGWSYTFDTLTGITVILQGNTTISLSDNSGGNLLYIGNEQTVILNGLTLKGHVSVSGGTFIMNGGTISDSRSTMGGGVHVHDGGTFFMKDGRISGNSGVYGGGVYVDTKAVFNMAGGVIWGNTATYYGGGVYVESGGVFAKTGGLINGYDGDPQNGNAVKENGAAKSGRGHAVYVDIGNNTNKRKEATAVINMDLRYDGKTGEFSGAWDY